MALQEEQVAAHFYLCHWCDERLYLCAAVKEPDTFMSRLIDEIIVRVLLSIQQTMG
jgi:hypothetical protein